MTEQDAGNERLAEIFLGQDKRVAELLGARGFAVERVRGPDGEALYVARVSR